MFTEQDYIEIEQHGISRDSLLKQIDVLNKKSNFVELARPILNGDGLLSLSETEIMEMIKDYQFMTEKVKMVKFVPASGAASRMFKKLFCFFNENDFNAETEEVIAHLEDFAFFQDLKKCLNKNNLDIYQLIENKDYKTIVSYILEKKGLNYAALPKALLAFHNYNQDVRTALEEHLVEAAAYACGKDKMVHVHFTISPEHAELFNQKIQKILAKYESLLNVKFNITFSFQDSSTDTIAFDMQNQPFRTKEKKLLFRPGGHGSLIKNLNKLNADIAFIKNIDNVTIDELKIDTIKYKKLLASLLLSYQSKVFFLLNQLKNAFYENSIIEESERLLKDVFFIELPHKYHTFSLSQKAEYLFKLLDRPIRICGVVKQTGEPGGGPFWVKNENGEFPLQIVETSEINLENKQQKQILESSRFFNPVDIVCSLKHFDGTFFNFDNYVDYNRFFISQKSQNGENLKAIENPGLWNGAMSNWLTLFVLVPLSTFSPVKTINDLLHKEHLNRKNNVI